MTKIYIAGPMTGHPDWNFPAFFEAEEQLLALGYEVINPAHNDGPTVELALESAGSPERPNHTWAYYMKRDLPHVLEVDMLCVLPGWQKSKGASLEVAVSKAIGLPLMILKDGKLVPRVECIGLSGYARSGKDTVAAHLIGRHSYERVAFADSIREALYKLNPKVPINDVYGFIPLRPAVDMYGWEALKEDVPHVRNLLQRLGTEVGREMFGSEFWVDAAINKIPDGAKVVFTDVRFPNEAEAIRGLGGRIYRVTREGVAPTNGHISEVALDDYEFDGVIDNNSTIEILYEGLDKKLGL